MEKKVYKKRATDKVRFSIGAKLITIITIIVLVSLGSITMLASWLIREDLKIAAEVNNIEANRRSAAEAEDLLVNMRTYSLILLQTLHIIGRDNEAAQEAADFFFEQNQQAAAFAYNLPGQPEHILINKKFFSSRSMDTSLADSFFITNSRTFMQAASGETIALNASPHFNRSLIALFIPWQNGAASVIFSPEKLNESFGSGSNPSYLVNNKGDILAHLNSTVLLEEVNVSEDSFIRLMQESPDRSRQMITQDGESELRLYSAFTKINIGGCAVITSIEYDKVFEGIIATTRRNLYLTAAVLFISIMFIWFFSKSISIPLKSLTGAARNIEGGQFDQEIKIKSGDEIGLLGHSFRRMNYALRIFGRFTNRDLAVKAMRGEIKPGGLSKHATIFFSDIRDFTEKSEKFTDVFGEDASNRIVFWLNNYLSKMVECVEETGGVVDKFIGDAVMAHWGTAYTSGDPAKDAYNGVNAALMMRSAVVNINKERKDPNDPGNPFIQIGCGINTGIVTAGQIGSDLRMEYTVIGDPVNLASRVESLNKTLGTDILISEDTWNLVNEHFLTKEMPPVTVKGKAKPVRIFAVINYANAVEGPTTLSEVRSLLGITVSKK
ncbi:MAG: HAMP domain-containing protein [Treponema sp.]|jgi:adenylate cyclase|nr:HAMP domain-containing protein [Treponema sp.]